MAVTWKTWCEEYKNTYRRQMVKAAEGVMNNSLRNHDYEATEASDMLPLQNLDEE